MYVDWITAAITLLGVYLVGCKWKVGFLIGAVGCIGWCTVGVLTGAYGMLGSCVPMFFMNLYCWWKWWREERKVNIPPPPQKFYECTRKTPDVLLCSYVGGHGECRLRVPPKPFSCWMERDYKDKDAFDPKNWPCNREKDNDENKN